MTEQTLEQPNPYAVTSVDSIEHQEVANGEPLLVAYDRTNIGGRLWLPCTQTVYTDRLELKFLMQTFTLPIDRLRMLRSGGKGWGRHLEIFHDDPLAPKAIQFVPLFPGEWFNAFETLDVPTEDEADLRESSQLYHRSSVWVSNAEALFWLMWIGLIITVPSVAAVVNFWKDHWP